MSASDDVLTAPQFQAPVIKPYVPPPEPPYIPPPPSVNLAGLLSRLDGPARLTALLQGALSGTTPFTAANFAGMYNAPTNDLPSLLAYLLNHGG
jgi:hypothetical protein